MSDQTEKLSTHIYFLWSISGLIEIIGGFFLVYMGIYAFFFDVFAQNQWNLIIDFLALGIGTLVYVISFRSLVLSHIGINDLPLPPKPYRSKFFSVFGFYCVLFFALLYFLDFYFRWNLNNTDADLIIVFFENGLLFILFISLALASKKYRLILSGMIYLIGIAVGKILLFFYSEKFIGQIILIAFGVTLISVGIFFLKKLLSKPSDIELQLSRN
ncbi:MAG: hypothetical protein ACTSRE_04245 [Promethearchaeota archaeon]